MARPEAYEFAALTRLSGGINERRIDVGNPQITSASTEDKVKRQCPLNRTQRVLERFHAQSGMQTLGGSMDFLYGFLVGF